MRYLTSITVSALAAIGLVTSGAAFARAKLVSATPAASAKASKVLALTLTFSEAVTDKQSGVEIVMTSMPGMAHHAPMKVSGFKTALSADRKTMSITLPRALPAGTYDVKWHAVTADTQKGEGVYSFTAK